MASPTIVDIPHRLGRAEATRRIKARIGELPAHLPGGGTVRSEWTAEDRLALDVAALGQSVSGSVEIGDTSIRVSMVLPPMLSFMSGMIASTVRAKGGQLLLGERPGGDGPAGTV